MNKVVIGTDVLSIIIYNKCDYYCCIYIKILNYKFI